MIQPSLSVVSTAGDVSDVDRILLSGTKDDDSHESVANTALPSQRGWGSFATASVEELIAAADKESYLPSSSLPSSTSTSSIITSSSSIISYVDPVLPIVIENAEKAAIVHLEEMLNPFFPHIELYNNNNNSNTNTSINSKVFIPLCVDSHLGHVLCDSFRTHMFLLDESYLFLNHGAFGCTLKSTLLLSQEWQIHCEKQPLRFFDRELLPLLVKVTKELAHFIKGRPSRLLLTNNATTALSQCFRSLQYQYIKQITDREGKHALNIGKGYSLLRLSLCYGSVKKMTDELCKSTDMNLVDVEISLPLTDKRSIYNQVEAAILNSISDHQPVSIAVFDHITSNSALLLPVKSLIKLCHSHSIIVIIDGAHGVGQMDLSLEELNADMYIGNCHKWMSSHKGVAFMYISQQFLDYHIRIFPPVISHGYNSGLISDWLFAGMKDYSPILSILTTIKLWNTSIKDKVTNSSSIINHILQRECSNSTSLLNIYRSYSAELCTWATRMLCQEWESDTLLPTSTVQPTTATHPFSSIKDEYLTESSPCMSCVRLCGPLYAQSVDEHNIIQDLLYSRYKIEVPIKRLADRLYVRISAHLYNKPEQYMQLAIAMKQIRGKK